MTTLQLIDEGPIWKNPYPAVRAQVALKGTNVCLGNGEILHLARVGQARQSLDGRPLLLRSKNYGKSWQQIPAPPLECRKDYVLNSGWLSHGPKGEIWAVLNRQRLVEPEDQRWTPQNSGWIGSEAIICYSTDKGLTWSSPCVATATSPEGGFQSVGSPVHTLASGELMLVFEPFFTSSLARMEHQVVTIYSADNGQTWTGQTILAQDNTHRIAYFDPRLARLADDRWICMFWTHDKQADESLNTTVAYSEDGHVWTDPQPTPLWGFLTLPVVLADGRLLVVYNHRRAPQGIRCAVSEDAGRTWDMDHEYVLWDARARKITGELVSESIHRNWDGTSMEEMWTWDFGVPNPVLLDDGSVLVSFYATQMDHVMHQRYVRFRV